MLHNLFMMSGWNCNKVQHAANFIAFWAVENVLTATWSRQVLNEKLFIFPEWWFNSGNAKYICQISSEGDDRSYINTKQTHKKYRFIPSWLSWHIVDVVRNVFAPSLDEAEAPSSLYTPQLNKPHSYLRCPTCWARSAVCQSQSWLCNSQTPWEHSSEIKHTTNIRWKGRRLFETLIYIRSK